MPLKSTLTILSTAGGVLLFRGEASAVGPPSASQVPLDPLTIPKFAHALPIQRTFAPTVITSNGRVVRHEYTISAARTSGRTPRARP